MSSPLKKIKDCSECQQAIQMETGNLEKWEVKKKEVLDKIQEENCLHDDSWRMNNRGHSEVVSNLLAKYKTVAIVAGEDWGRVCSKCEKSWHRNQYGDETGNKELAVDNWRESHNCQKGNNNDNSNNDRESILNYFKQHNIKSAKLEGDKLLIEYNISQTETKCEIKDIDNSELKKIKSYSQKIGKSELSLSDLEQSSNNSPDNKSNKGLYIGLAVVGMLVVGVVAWLLMRNNKGKSN